MATVTYESPDGVEEVTVDADRISDSGKVHGVRIQLEDGGYCHVPYNRIYAIRTSEQEGKVDYSST